MSGSKLESATCVPRGRQTRARSPSQGPAPPQDMYLLQLAGAFQLAYDLISHNKATRPPPQPSCLHGSNQQQTPDSILRGYTSAATCSAT
jgi:hypothetical protein